MDAQRSSLLYAIRIARRPATRSNSSGFAVIRAEASLMVRRAPSPIPSTDRRPPASPFQILWKRSEAARRRAGTISGRSVRARSTASGELEAPAWIIPRSDPSFGASARGVQACASDPAGLAGKSSLIIAQRESPTDDPHMQGNCEQLPCCSRKRSPARKIWRTPPPARPFQLFRMQDGSGRWGIGSRCTGFGDARPVGATGRSPLPHGPENRKAPGAEATGSRVQIRRVWTRTASGLQGIGRARPACQRGN